MSIYSGFATRNQEQTYDKMLYNLISTLLLRLGKFYKREPVDENIFLKIVFDQEKSLRKMEKHKYLDPKYSELLTIFKKQISEEDVTLDFNEKKDTNKVEGKQRSRATQNHQLNRTLSLLGRQFGELRANADKLQKPEMDQDESLAKIQERKRHVSKRKRKEKKSSIKSNLDIWQMRQERPPELPSLHPLHTMQHTIMSRTKFNNFSEKMHSKEIYEPPYDEEPESLKNVLQRPPKFRAKMYFK